ncbi:MAG: 3-methyl-2-oxobutanoate dehydrogenase (2-methylpropanoyl-transferring) subunit alpha [Hyphomonadaceae bacterium]|nr:3-methyl-2-oxobutanoate dehydrogenase (2-methylpropanoyl-transferring) subunit alpha [Hyphomonadaceae bacterium]
MTKRSNVSKLYVPEPPFRPGDKPDFSHIVVPAEHSPSRPDPMVDAYDTEPQATGLVRVLKLDGEATGDWNPNLNADTLREGLRHMLLTRLVDDRMFSMQRQGKLSFYMKSTGEEAVAVATAMAVRPTDMVFPTYRQQGILMARGWELKKLMCQCLSNAGDPLEGRSIPVLYSVREKGFFSVSGNLGTQMIQAVGWGMACAYRGNDDIAIAFTGEGASAEGDFHYALNFASTYRAPVILNVVNNQWAISSFQGIAAGQSKSFASRGLSWGLASLRVDGNDFLAVYAAMQWAAERARRGGGATVVEFFTYRKEGHSTSDDPTKYRPRSEPDAWPFGDPIGRLTDHLIKLGEWDEKRHEALIDELKVFVRETYKEAEALGTLATPSNINPATMFEEVFEETPSHLRRQRQEFGV